MQVKKLNNLSETFNVKPIKSQLKVAKKLHVQNIFKQIQNNRRKAKTKKKSKKRKKDWI